MIERSDLYPWYPLLDRSYTKGKRTINVLSFDEATQMYRVRRSWTRGWALMSQETILACWTDASTNVQT